MTEMRLQKFLSRAGICSRRKGEEYIKAGWVKVNGKIVTELGIKVNPERDTVEVDSEAIRSDTAPSSRCRSFEAQNFDRRRGASPTFQVSRGN